MQKIIFCAGLYLFFFLPLAQAQEPSPNDTVLVDTEPQPLNMDSVRRIIGYPKEARDAYIQGVVAVRVLIDKEGNYKRHIVLQEVPQLTENVEAHLSKLKFSPAIHKGKPIMFWVKIPFRFVMLNDGLSPEISPISVLNPKDFSPIPHIDVMPHLLEPFNVPYPKAAEKKRIGGDLIYFVIIDEKGQYVSHHTLLSEPIWGEAVEADFPKMKWSPMIRDGKADSCIVNMHFRYYHGELLTTTMSREVRKKFLNALNDFHSQKDEEVITQLELYFSDKELTSSVL